MARHIFFSKFYLNGLTFFGVDNRVAEGESAGNRVARERVERHDGPISVREYGGVVVRRVIRHFRPTHGLQPVGGVTVLVVEDVQAVGTRDLGELHDYAHQLGDNGQYIYIRLFDSMLASFGRAASFSFLMLNYLDYIVKQRHIM